MKKYLEASEHIDCDHSEIIALAEKLAANKFSDVEITKVLDKPNTTMVGELNKYQNIKDVFDNLPDATEI